MRAQSALLTFAIAIGFAFFFGVSGLRGAETNAPASDQKQKEVEQKKRDDLKRQVDYAQVRLERATKDLEYARKTEPPDKDLINAAQKEANYWTERTALAKQNFANPPQGPAAHGNVHASVAANAAALDGTNANVGKVIVVEGSKTNTIALVAGEPLTAWSALLRIQGFGHGRLTGVYVLRKMANGELHRINVNIKKIQAGKEKDVELENGDKVIAPGKFFSF